MNIDITPEEAKTILASLNNSTELKAKLQKIVDDVKPKERDFNNCFVTGYNINKEKIDGYKRPLSLSERETTFRTPQQVDAARALAQLTQCYCNHIRSKNLDNNSSELCVIRFHRDNYDNLRPVTFTVSPDVMWDNAFLVFTNTKIAQDFIDSHRTLLMQASYFLI
jgi:hypothetical protein